MSNSKSAGSLLAAQSFITRALNEIEPHLATFAKAQARAVTATDGAAAKITEGYQMLEGKKRQLEALRDEMRTTGAVPEPLRAIMANPVATTTPFPKLAGIK